MVTPGQTNYMGDACDFVNRIQTIEWQKVSETSRLFKNLFLEHPAKQFLSELGLLLYYKVTFYESMSIQG